MPNTLTCLISAKEQVVKINKKSITDNYLDFLNQLNDLVTSNPRSGVLKNLYNAIPKSINDKPTSNKQIKNIANLKLNFNHNGYNFLYI